MTAQPSRQTGSRILLAEDDDSLRGFLERALARAGYVVLSFSNGQDAYDRLLEEPFTLLLTDIVMPRMDGYEMFRALQEQEGSRDIPVIGLSSRCSPEEEAKLMRMYREQVLKEPPAPKLIQLGNSNAEAPKEEKEESGVSGD